MAAENTAARKLVSMDLSEAHDLLERLDREQRRQSIMGLVTIIVMAAALLSVWIIASARSGSPISRLAVVAVVFVVLVVAFAGSSVRRQRNLGRRQRQAASQLGVIAAHETLNLILGKTTKAEAERRRMERANYDQPLTVIADDTTYYGRIRDISEQGIGAIIPAALELGTQIALEFLLGSQTFQLQATVRQRNGVRYGFEFSQLSQAEREAIEQLRAGTPESRADGATSAG
jgi:PilZ domain